MEKSYLRRSCRHTYKFFNLEDGRTELVVGEIQTRLPHYGMKSLRTTEEYLPNQGISTCLDDTVQYFDIVHVCLQMDSVSVGAGSSINDSNP